jgi:6-phosphogluconolactonase
MTKVKVYQDVSAVMKAAARMFIDLANEAIKNHGYFSVALAGGSTPRALYNLLATPKYTDLINWSLVYVFWGDERCFPPDHVESNYRMTYDVLLAHVPLPSENIHRIHGEDDPRQAAEDYQKVLFEFNQSVAKNSDNPIRFDLLLLGLGEDGHTASLFPHSFALDETEQWVTATYVENMKSWRVTLTLRIINAASNILFTVTGKNKTKRLKHVLNGDFNSEQLPAQLVQPLNGDLWWFVDTEAMYGYNE